MANPFKVELDRRIEAPKGNPFAAELESRTPQPEMSGADALADAGMSALRGFNKGLVGTAAIPYRVADWLLEKLSGGQGLPDVEKMPLYKPYLDPPKPATDVGRYVQSATEAVGASALPTAGLVSAAPRLAALAPTTVPRAVGQSVGSSIAARPAAAVTADAVAATGAGLAQEGAKEQGFGPTGQFVAGMAGAAIPLSVAATVGGARRVVEAARARSDPYARVAAQLGDQSIDDLASSAATGATAINEPLARRVMDTLGEEMVRTGGNRQAAIPATLARLQAAGVAPSTAREQLRRVAQSQSDNELLFGEYPAVAASNRDTRLARNPANVTDAAAGRIEDSGTHWLTDYVANSGSGASSQRVRTSITDRMVRLRDQMRDRLVRMSPNQQTLQDADNLIANMTRQARQEYDAVYNSPGGTAVNYGMLHGLLPRIVDRHLNRMAGRSGEQAEALRAAVGELYTTTANGQQIIMPSLQMLQDMRGAIRGMITNASSPTNPRPHIVQTLQPLYRDITRLMERASPQWARANRRWADMNIAQTARELGEAFSMTPGPRFRDQMREFRQLAPEAQDLVRIEFSQKMLDKVEGAGDTHDLAKLFSTPHIRTMVRTVMGDDAAVDLARLIRDNSVATKSRSMIGGSPTQPRIQRQKEQDADLGILASADQANINSFRQFILDWTVGYLRERRNRGVARIITTPMRDTPAVAENLERMRRAAARVEQSAMPANRLSGIGGYLGSVPTAVDEE